MRTAREVYGRVIGGASMGHEKVTVKPHWFAGLKARARQRYQTECKCGWESRMQSNRENALSAFAVHRDTEEVAAEDELREIS